MNAHSFLRARFAGIFSLLILIGGLSQTNTRAITLTSSIPANGATGVSPSAPVVFTFNMAPADTSTIFVLFTDGGSGFFNTTVTWNASNTIMTNTPNPPFPNNTNVQWQIFDSTAGTLVGMGSFSTGTGSGGSGGSGTNVITTFSVIKGFLYDQTSTAAPVPDATTPYTFFASTVLASNRSATSITLTLPNNTSVSNLMQNPVAHEDYFLASFFTNQTMFSNSWPDGTYTFKVMSNATMQTVPVLLPATMVQPNAPHVSNYAAAQTVNPSQPFTLTWDAFQGGTTTDFVSVVIGTNFVTANPEGNGALNGTMTSVIIPANTLPTNSTFQSSLAFYRVLFATNAAGYATIAEKASTTDFILTTGSAGTIGPLKLLNPAFVSGTFNFDVTSGLSQTFTVEYSTNPANTNLWQSLVTTSSPSGDVRLADPHSRSNRSSFYRARNGP